MLRANIIIVLIFTPLTLVAQEKKKGGRPPAKVVISSLSSGRLAPQSFYTGTVYYKEVSNVACEVRGRVDTVSFEEGERLSKGAVLVRLDSELLQILLKAAKAEYELSLSDLDEAKVDLERVENLFKEESIAQQVYDEKRFKVKGLLSKSLSMSAAVKRINAEIRKKTIVAPFNGIVIDRSAERGEWCTEGMTVAVIGRDDLIDLVVDVPENIIAYLSSGIEVTVTVAGKKYAGKLLAVIPKGDVATRTFPVKIRVKNDTSLFEGMEASVALPSGEKVELLTVPADAVITKFGQNVVFAVVDSKAVMIPVKVIGYKNMQAGVESEKLKATMQVVIKGNERIMDGQALEIIK